MTVRSGLRFVVLFALATLLGAATRPVCAVTAQIIASGLELPVDIVNAGDGSNRLFIVEQAGIVQTLFRGVASRTRFLDIRARVLSGGEQGLLGLAFHPRYATNGRFFVDYTRQPDGATVIAEYRVNRTDPGVGDASSERILLTIPQPFANHNGGALRFGPDGYLYIGMGDGGSANDPGDRAQDTAELLGKILRIDVDAATPYAIPAGNPFAHGGGRAEIWALGVRNPWRFTFDRLTGDFYIGDVGQNAFEEIDRLPARSGAGTNFGWRVMEADSCTTLGGGPQCFSPALTPPIVAYSHADGCSVTGGNVYRGAGVPALAGRYVFGDYCSGRVWSAASDENGTWSVRATMITGAAISTFGEDEQGETYYADHGRGQIWQLVGEANDRVDVVEYYHAGLDHYFMTASPAEIDALDGGSPVGWTRTGFVLPSFASLQPDTVELCRYYIPPALGDSHFLSASAEECAAVAREFPGFTAEGPTRIFMALPDLSSGACAASQLPVYRVWNRRADSNHRYTASRTVRDEMVARGGIAEGYGADAVALCAPL